MLYSRLRKQGSGAFCFEPVCPRDAVAVGLAQQIHPILANLYQINTTQPPQNPPCWKCQIQLHLTQLALNERLDSRQACRGWRRAAATGGVESAAMAETSFGQKDAGGLAAQWRSFTDLEGNRKGN